MEQKKIRLSKLNDHLLGCRQTIKVYNNIETATTLFEHVFNEYQLPDA